MAKKSSSSGQFSEAISEAQKAVASMPQDRLKEIAFERILDHLLAGLSGAKPSTSNSKVKHKIEISTPTSKGTHQGDGPLVWLTEIVEEGFFSQPKSSAQIIEELGNRSHTLSPQDITWPLQNLCHNKLLRRKKMSPSAGGRPLIHWVNW